MTGLVSVLKNKQTGYQIGDNTNLFDWTYVGNVAHAHLLAADRLGEEVSMELFDEPLSPIILSTGQTKIPTSNARPIGPKRPEDVTDEDRRLDEAYHGSGTVTYENELRPVLRTRFDQFANPMPDEDDLPEDVPPTHLSVAGQAFFITNCEPLFFWDFPRAVWAELGHVPSSIWYLNRTFGLLLAGAAETWSKLMGKEPGFTQYRVKYSSQSRYYNTERARRVLGYEPIVGVQEGIARTVQVRFFFFLLHVLPFGLVWTETDFP